MIHDDHTTNHGSPPSNNGLDLRSPDSRGLEDDLYYLAAGGDGGNPASLADEDWGAHMVPQFVELFFDYSVGSPNAFD